MNKNKQKKKLTTTQENFCLRHIQCLYTTGSVIYEYFQL